MPMWQEVCLKGFLLLAAAVALLGSLVFFISGMLGLGGLSSPGADSGLGGIAVVLGFSASQIWLIVAGFRSAWRWIGRWSEERAEKAAG